MLLSFVLSFVIQVGLVLGQFRLQNVQRPKIPPRLTVNEVRISRTSERTPVLNLDNPTFPNEHRVANGNPADYGEYPWMVFIRFGSNQCGGTLLSNEWVLTAAHCVHSADPISILIGALTNDGQDPNGVTRNMQSKCCHKDFNRKTLENDICLLKLSSPVQFGTYIQKVQLPAQDEELNDDTPGVVAGWGYNEDLKLLPKLQEGDVNVINKLMCQSWYGTLKIPRNHFCAGHEEGGVDTCGGDSGGPLMVQKRGVFVQRGITSFGPRDCGKAQQPGAYLSVSKYVTWIESKMNNPCVDPVGVEMPVVNGAPAGLGSYPWMVFIRLPSRKQCGGTLLSESYVLTAAHCVQSATPTEILLGAYYNDGTDPNAVSRTMDSKCCHADFDDVTLENDICLIKLSSPVVFGTFIQKITLPSSDSQLPVNTISTVMGWGLDENNNLRRELLAADVKVIDKIQCRTWYSMISRVVPDKHICAGHPEGGPDTCNGDSGGPLVVQQAGEYIIRGITSFGSDPCGARNLPGVYTQVSKYITWINEKMNNPCTAYEWSSWKTVCDVTCGDGVETRTRQCKDEQGQVVAHSNCSGDAVLISQCHLSPCSMFTVFIWSDWQAKCDVTCGEGLETKTRQCKDGRGNVVAHSNCSGDAVEISQCSRPPCSVFTWTEWQSTCDVTCGDGLETRTRQCMDEKGIVVAHSNCAGDAVETGQCRKPSCPVFMWSEWKSSCDVTCGEGVETRTRQCLDEQGIVVAHSNCPGDAVEIGQCREPNCSAFVWSEWKSSCDVTCGEGVETRTRQCLDEQGIVVAHSNCPGDAVTLRPCNKSLCMPDHQWGPWKKICSETCGNGIEYGLRDCLDQTGEKVAASLCFPGGQFQQFGICQTKPCSVYKWSSWTTECSVTCGEGVETKRRRCLDNEGLSGIDNLCHPGNAVEWYKCNLPPCQEYKWGQWQVYSCSVTCDKGMEYKIRYCEDFSGQRVSKDLCTEGVQFEVSRCTREPCVSSQSYRWGPWKTTCTVTCGTGTEFSTRACLNNNNQVVSSTLCFGDQMKYRQCTLQACSTPAPSGVYWGAWKEWSSCRKRFFALSRCTGLRSTTRDCFSGNVDVDPGMCIETLGGDYYSEESCTLSNC